jgi:hypothetical protein
MGRWRHKAPKHILGAKLFVLCKSRLGAFRNSEHTPWGIWHRTSAKNYINRRIEASPMAHGAAGSSLFW